MTSTAPSLVELSLLEVWTSTVKSPNVLNAMPEREVQSTKVSSVFPGRTMYDSTVVSRGGVASQSTI